MYALPFLQSLINGVMPSKMPNFRCDMHCFKERMYVCLYVLRGYFSAANMVSKFQIVIVLW